ncbi:MAG: hypothetical protein IPI67_37870 [Myxococcales bacterium]|nr:hypothetical protein [Myxococcales bacterium]
MDAWAKPTGNLSPNCSAKGLRAGMLSLAVALAAAVALREMGLAVGWRLLLVLPFYVAVAGLTKGLFGV